jgi:2',3'-cyclic-nucleotide 2'-phosphodiesterase (5'-nucleotidase family)
VKKRLFALLLVLCLALSLSSVALAAESGDIVVLFTNDVHCAVDKNIGYAGLAAYKAEMESEVGADHVTLIDAGDAVQGAALGTLSEGEYIIDIMNEVGYDIMVPGNHEFDYGMERMQELMDMLDAKVISSNFVDLQTGDTVYDPYTIIDYGNLKVAYVGICTPKTFTSSTPRYFQDDMGNYIYSFCEDDTGDNLYDAVQTAVDGAAASGADVIVAVGHCGVGDDLTPWQLTEIIANTTGIAAFIDAHSHSTIAGDTVENKNGEDVVLTSSGAGLMNIGKLTNSSNGSVTTQHISDYTENDPTVEAFVNNILAETKRF